MLCTRQMCTWHMHQRRSLTPLVSVSLLVLPHMGAAIKDGMVFEVAEVTEVLSFLQDQGPCHLGLPPPCEGATATTLVREQQQQHRTPEG